MSIPHDHVLLDLGDGCQAMLVPSHDVIRVSDVHSARHLLARTPGGPSAELRDLARRSGSIDVFADDDDVNDAIAELIASGEYSAVIVQRPHADSSGFGLAGPDGAWSQATRLADLAGPEAPPGLHTLGLSLLDRTGVPYAGLELRLVHSNGSRERIVLDALGRWHSEAVPGPGPTRVELPAELALTEGQRRGRAVEGFVLAAGDVVVERHPVGNVTLAVLDREYRIIVRGGRRAFSS